MSINNANTEIDNWFDLDKRGNVTSFRCATWTSRIPFKSDWAEILDAEPIGARIGYFVEVFQSSQIVSIIYATMPIESAIYLCNWATSHLELGSKKIQIYTVYCFLDLWRHFDFR